MELSPHACYRAVVARDCRQDGRFFTCVRTTGIYCRPVCPARPPRFENCDFVPTAAAAETAGFRPCLRCRPECSPEAGAARGTSASVSRALSLIEAGHLDTGSVTELAERLGMGDRQLRRLFHKHLGATPVAIAQTRRLLLAQQLLRDTSLPMVQVALASGFTSVRRFNETFRQRYGVPPGQRRRATSAEHDGALHLTLTYRPPYDWQAMLAFLATRAMAGVEHVDGERYWRVVDAGGHLGTIAVEHLPKKQALRVTMWLASLTSVPDLVARVRRVFDLGADPERIAETLGHDPALAHHVAARPGLRVPGGWDGYETAVRAVLGQQISVPAATRLASRFAERFGQTADGLASPHLGRLFPRPGTIPAEDIAALGMPRARARALSALSEAAARDPRLFDPRADLESAVGRLRSLPGIGEWTAQYIAMRSMRESDAFLAGDVALQRACLKPGARGPAAQAELLTRAEAWRPWRAYAVLHLWTAERAQAETPTTRSTKGHHATPA